MSTAEKAEYTPPRSAPRRRRWTWLLVLAIAAVIVAGVVRGIRKSQADKTSAVEPPAVAARDLRGDLARLLAGHSPGIYLLRPDRYVAAFFPSEDISAASDGIATLVRGTWPSPISGYAARSDEKA